MRGGVPHTSSSTSNAQGVHTFLTFQKSTGKFFLPLSLLQGLDRSTMAKKKAESSIRSAKKKTNGSQPPKVVVTGRGMTTGLGHTVEENWNALICDPTNNIPYHGKSAKTKVDLYNSKGHPLKIAGQIHDQSKMRLGEMTAEYGGILKVYRNNYLIPRSMIFGLYAAHQAFLDAGLRRLDLEDDDTRRYGVILGSPDDAKRQ